MTCHEDDDRDDYRADDFRCHGCETPTFNGRLCASCRKEYGMEDDA